MRRTPTRGERNHNPGNIDYSSRNPWQGLANPPIEQDVSRPRFARFTEPKWGIRALMRTLVTYYDVHKLSTVAGIIGRWAPSNENDTSSYANFVARRLKVDPHAEIVVTDYDTMIALTNAIIFHENAGLVYPSDVVHQAALLAGIQPARPKPFMATKTVTGTVVTGAGVALEPLVDMAASVSDTGTQLQSVASYSELLTTISGLLIVAGLALTIYGRMKVRKKTGE